MEVLGILLIGLFLLIGPVVKALDAFSVSDGAGGKVNTASSVINVIWGLFVIGLVRYMRSQHDSAQQQQ